MMKKLLTSLALATASILGHAQTPTSNVRLVKDINIGKPSTFSDSYILGHLEDTLLLAVKTEENGYWELWRSDGSEAGTYMLATTTTNWMVPFEAYLVTDKGFSIILIEDKLYSTDGTLAGTKVLKSSFWGNNLVWKNNLVYYESSGSVMSYDPATNTTLTVYDTGNTSVDDFFIDGADLYYTASNYEDGYMSYLYKYSNGDTTRLLKIDKAYMRDYWNFSKLPSGIIVFYFNGQAGHSLCATNGTPEGSSVLKVFSRMYHLGLEGCHTYGGKYYFNAINTVEGEEERSLELFVSDGTAAGTQSLYTPTNKMGTPYDITYYKDSVYFSAVYEGALHHIYRTDGTPTGTNSVIKWPISNMSGFELVSNSNNLYFVAVDEDRRALSQELWVSSGTVAGSTLYETVAGDADLSIKDIYTTDHKVFFNGYTEEYGRELYEFTPLLVGITDLEEQNSLCWLPNPAQDKISFCKSTEIPEQVYMVDLLGHKIGVEVQDNSIALTHLQAGNYILSYTLQGKTYRNMITKR